MAPLPGAEAVRPVVAFGPEMPGWGSWEWAGADVQAELGKYSCTGCFRTEELPDGDVAFVVKHPPTLDWVARVAGRAAVIYCPIDFYGSPADIDADAAMLRRCARVVVHCERLRRYFEPYAPVVYMDHHVKFCTGRSRLWGAGGSLLWVGVRTNVPPLASWIKAHPLPEELLVVTNLEDPQAVPAPADFGFLPERKVLIKPWSPEFQLERMFFARAAIDIKGDDFRSRHKPAAKAIDFIASELPLAMNPDSSPVEHLARMGFEVASPLDTDWWLSKEYFEETKRFGRALRELLSLERIGRRYKRLIEEVLAERGSNRGGVGR